MFLDYSNIDNFEEYGDNCGNNEEISVSLHKIVDDIDLPISIKFSILPGDDVESMFIATQLGIIYIIRDNKIEKFLDIRNKILQLGVNDTPYDERGLLGLTFHPNFSKNGKFYIYYSQDGSQNKSPIHSNVNPCDSNSLKQHWDNKSNYDHVDILEEWIYCKGINYDNNKILNEIRSGESKLNRNIISIIQPFFNNNGRDNLTFSPSGELILGIGDGGSSLDPFNLSQNDNFLLGKLIAIDLDKICSECGVYPISEISDMLPCQSKAFKIIAKGIHNTSHPSYDNYGLQYIPNTGETGFESVYSFPLESCDIINLGWRPWEGVLPTTKEESCYIKGVQADKIIIWEREKYPKNSVVIKITEGETIGFLSNDGYIHSVVLADHKWKIAQQSKYYLKPSRKLRGNIKFDEVGEYYLVDPYDDELRIKVKVMSSNYPKTPNITQDCIIFINESLHLKNRHHPLTSIYHKDLNNSVNEIVGGEFYKGKSLNGLNNSYVFADLTQRDHPEGSLYQVKVSKNPEKFQEAKKINVIHHSHRENFYVSLGTNYKQDRLFLGVYNSLGVNDRRMGAVYEILQPCTKKSCLAKCLCYKSSNPDYTVPENNDTHSVLDSSEFTDQTVIEYANFHDNKNSELTGFISGECLYSFVSLSHNNTYVDDFDNVFDNDPDYDKSIEERSIEERSIEERTDDSSSVDLSPRSGYENT